MRKYFGRKLLIYLLTFFLAVTIDWLIPRFMPGKVPCTIDLARIRFTNRCKSGSIGCSHMT